MRSIELVGVLHLLDRFLAPLLGERLVAPIVEQPVMQPVLVDGRQFVPQALVEKIDDARIAFHDRAPAISVAAAHVRLERYLVTIPVACRLTPSSANDWPLAVGAG